MEKKYFILILILFGIKLNGQTVVENLTGKVSFVSTQNVYVKFQSTEGIYAGDTLFMSSDGKLLPVLKVTNLSSSSCVCSTIRNISIKLSDEIVARKKIKTVITIEKPVEKVGTAFDLKKDSDTFTKKTLSSQIVKGSLSAYSYSGFSNTGAANSTQFRYSLSLNVTHIGNSKFSFENYMSFRHKLGDWGEVKTNLFNALKIYNMAVRYDLNKTTQISVGRKINSNISSIGAMDGLQVEKTFNKFSIGAVVGYRPSFTDYSFDRKLFQYGGYLAFSSVTSKNYVESSIAFMQQMNNGKTDRRFLYFQFSNSIIKNLNLFSTFETDLYKLTGDSISSYVSGNTFSLTSFFLSLRYKMTKNFSLTGSYDGRKNVIYYETFKSFNDRILETGMRQSYRLQADYRITNSLMLGVQGGYRNLKSDPKPTRNAYGYLTYSQIPGLKISLTLSGTYLESNYVNSKIGGASISRDFFQGILYTSLGYHHVEYKYPEGLQNTVQDVGEMNISLQASKKMSFSVNWEGTFEKQYKYNTLFLQIRRRF
jgi:hypothetical protein